MDNNFDPILYSIGDRVIAKNKSPDINGNEPKEEEVVAVENVEFTKGRVCQILYFKSNPSSFELAMNYEPVDPDMNAKYYEIIKASGFTTTKGRTIKSSKPKQVKESSVRTFKIKEHNKDI